MTEHTRHSHRPLWTVVCCLLGAAIALWGSSTLDWFVPARHGTSARGSDAVTELVPLALLALAALAAMFAGGPWLKRVIGVLLAVSAVYLVWRGIAGVADTTGVTVATAPSGDPTGQQPWARGLAVLAGLLELLAAFTLFTKPAALPAMGAKYSRKDKSERPTDPDQQMWQALSEGEDPTSQSQETDPVPESGADQG